MIFSGLTLYAEHITIEVAPHGPTLTNKAPAKLIGSDKLKNVRDAAFQAATQQAEKIQQNVIALSNKLDVDMDSQIYFVNKIMSELLNNESIVMTEEKYKLKMKLRKARGQ